MGIMTTVCEQFGFNGLIYYEVYDCLCDSEIWCGNALVKTSKAHGLVHISDTIIAPLAVIFPERTTDAYLLCMHLFHNYAEKIFLSIVVMSFRALMCVFLHANTQAVASILDPENLQI